MMIKQDQISGEHLSKETFYIIGNGWHTLVQGVGKSKKEATSKAKMAIKTINAIDALIVIKGRRYVVEAFFADKGGVDVFAVDSRTVAHEIASRIHAEGVAVIVRDTKTNNKIYDEM